MQWFLNLFRSSSEAEVLSPNFVFQGQIHAAMYKGNDKITALNTELDDVDAEIEELLAYRSKLTAQRAELVENLNAHRKAAGLSVYDIDQRQYGLEQGDE
ncbi:hypothetical protein Arno18_121 [Pectobacterium phage Arno18]|uniref:Uncharacterized protein n=1 Tax=Pectobacterium phage Arno18 TaxID=2500578 RepID=A0A678ZZJ9_9CAUD|nr:hypothetical protein Arno18_121 [Pectobacterium phage Arno18]